MNFSILLRLSAFSLLFVYLSCSKKNDVIENRPPENFEVKSITYENQQYSVSWSVPNDPDGDILQYDLYVDDVQLLSGSNLTTFSGKLPYNSVHEGRIIATDKQGGNSEVSFFLEMPESKILFFSVDDVVYALDVNTQKVLWKNQMNGLIRGLHTTLGDQVFTHFDKLTSRDILTGDVKWIKETSNEYESHFIITDGEAIYRKINYSAFERLNAEDGSTEWTVSTFESRGPAGIDDQNIYLTDRSSPFLRVYDKNTGDNKWNFSIPYQYGGDNYYNQIGHTPVVSDNKIFIRTGYGYLFALERESGSIIWQTRLVTDNISNFKGSETRPLVYEDNLIVLANSKLFSVKKDSGEIFWRTDLGVNIYSSPFLYKDHIYFTSDDYLFCVEVATGNLKWKQSVPSQIQISPIVYDDMIFVGGDDYYYAFNTDDASEIWRFYTGGYAYTSPTLVIGESNKIIYPNLNPSTNGNE